MVERIATFTQSGAMTRELLRLQSEYAESSAQASSGLKSSSYQGISEDTFKLLQLQSSYDHLVAQSENAQTALDRTEYMYSSLSSMAELIASVTSELSSAISNGDGGTIDETAADALTEFAALLNAQISGNYLFGGSVTDTAPVDVSALASLTSPTSADISYYQGDSYLASVKASDTLNVSYGVTADNSAFEQAIRAFQLVVSNPSDAVSLNEAYNLLQSATADIAEVQASVSSKASLIDNKISENSEDMNLLDSMISGIRDADLAEVTVKITELETQLEAAYSITSKLLNLKLTDYLK